MEVLYELRIRFGEEGQDIVALERDADHLQLEQGSDVFIIPKKNAAAFADALGSWISSGGRMPNTTTA